ncbi:MAG: hypothetical protein GY820_08205, partial [Gammaproteobacteria bacterium]|nr:hypothetical protein [Gammaproteobacteria bacterium]
MIACPLHKLTEKGITYEWTTECEEAFETLKCKLTEPPVLHYPDTSKGMYYLETDGSSRGLGAVLAQKDESGKLCPIAYASSGLSKSQQSYGVTEVEALACVFAVRYFHTYIMGCEVVLITDHNSLTFLMKQPNPIPRLQRWILSLDQYRITWMYRKGTANLVADALSRRYQSAEESELAQSELIKLDAVICRTGGHFRLTELKCMIAAMVTRSQSRVVRPNSSALPSKISLEAHSEKAKDNLKLEGDRVEMDRTNNQL